MWLPRPLYERIPQFWLLLGLLFMASGTYLGFEFAVAFVYFGIGAFCIAWSFCIFVMRANARRRGMAALGGINQVLVDDNTRPFLASDIARAASMHAAARGDGGDNR